MGQPVAAETAIDGTATLNLGGHDGGAILLMLTDLGPTYTAKVAELTVS